jgi:hypothetical protein
MGNVWERIGDIVYRASIVVLVIFGALIVFAVGDVFLMDHGIYIGSLHEPRPWIESGKRVEGPLLVCLYFGLKDVYHEHISEVYYWPPGTSKTALVPETLRLRPALPIDPKVIGVTSCPWIKS